MNTDDHNPSDYEFLRRWKNGDIQAGDILLKRHYPAIARFFRRKVGENDCKDLVQSTFLASVEAFDRFRAESTIRALLFGIAWNKLRMHLRDRPRPTEPLDDMMDPLCSTPRTLLAKQQDTLRLRKAMRKLEPEREVMLELFYTEELSLDEISEVMGRPIGTIKTQMHRSRRQLGRMLAES